MAALFQLEDRANERGLSRAMFFAMTATAGWRVALAAAMVEAAYRGTVSGFDGALVEAVSPSSRPGSADGWRRPRSRSRPPR